MQFAMRFPQLADSLSARAKDDNLRKFLGKKSEGGEADGRVVCKYEGKKALWQSYFRRF